MPDRFVGRRTPEGGWSWEAPEPQRSKRRRNRLLIVLVTGAGIVSACLLVAGILLANRDHDESAGPLPSVAPTPAWSSNYFAVWDTQAREWQSSPLVLSEAVQPTATYLLNISGSEGQLHDVLISFECLGEGRVELVAFSSASPAQLDSVLTPPGPGRTRPDTTALEKSVAVWGATFTDAPAWDGASAACFGGRALDFSTTARGDLVTVIWTAEFEPGSVGDEAAVFTTEVGVDDEHTGTIPVSFTR